MRWLLLMRCVESSAMVLVATVAARVIVACRGNRKRLNGEDDGRQRGETEEPQRSRLMTRELCWQLLQIEPLERSLYLPDLRSRTCRC